ncbi:MAG: 6-bladed beta-propeller [Gemmatimonadetes bacterium]|nr:6-bladed beta-propeller [Gemmatimonadota bacterium]
MTVASLPLACGPISDSRNTTETVVETETIGDTTVVRTVSGSVWGGDAKLVPEVSIGELDGAEECLFGSVSAIAVDDDHNVYVLDRQARHVRVFDSEGTYVKTLGRGRRSRIPRCTGMIRAESMWTSPKKSNASSSWTPRASKSTRSRLLLPLPTSTTTNIT